MAVKFLDFIGLQKFWEKCKKTFLHTNNDGKIYVLDFLELANSMAVKGSLHLYGPELVSSEVYCDEDGTLVFDGDARFDNGLTMRGVAVATVNDVTAAVANAGHLKREKVDVLPGVATAKENVIYMVTNSTTGNNKFDEYMLIDGAWEKTGSSDIDLSGYSTTEQMNSAISTAISNAHTAITGAEIDALA